MGLAAIIAGLISVGNEEGYSDRPVEVQADDC